jgi:hypothetical protein
LLDCHKDICRFKVTTKTNTFKHYNLFFELEKKKKKYQFKKKKKSVWPKFNIDTKHQSNRLVFGVFVVFVYFFPKKY